MNALPRKASSCHNVKYNDWKLENTHPDSVNSNTSMKFNSCRLTSPRGGAVSAAYTAIISDFWVTGGCVITLGSTALWHTIVMATWNLYASCWCGTVSLLVGGGGGRLTGGRGAVLPACKYCIVPQHLPLTFIGDRRKALVMVQLYVVVVVAVVVVEEVVFDQCNVAGVSLNCLDD